MVKHIILWSVVGIFLATLVLSFARVVFAQSPDERYSKVAQQIKQLEEQIAQAQSTQKTLASQIASFDNQIQLTTLRIDQARQKIAQLETDIGNLSQKIVRLEDSLVKITDLLLKRIVETYEQSKKQNDVELLFSSQSFAQLVARYRYVQLVQANDKKLLIQMQATKNNYQEQKSTLEDKQAEVEAAKKDLEKHQATLAQQKKDKEYLLEVTKNDEKRYQQLLSSAKAEQQALLQILAGGNVVKEGPVNTGDTVGFTIAGASGCSTGNHLHFEVRKNGELVNPATMLKSISLAYDGDPDQIGSVSPQGSWDWPIAEPVIIEQGFGMTSFAKLGAYGGGPHTGVDLFISNISSSVGIRVRAVAAGTLYRGSVQCRNGVLPFARIDQSDGVQTYYLHIQ